MTTDEKGNVLPSKKGSMAIGAGALGKALYADDAVNSPEANSYIGQDGHGLIEPDEINTDIQSDFDHHENPHNVYQPESNNFYINGGYSHDENSEDIDYVNYRKIPRKNIQQQRTRDFNYKQKAAQRAKTLFQNNIQNIKKTVTTFGDKKNGTWAELLINELFKFYGADSGTGNAQSLYVITIKKEISKEMITHYRNILTTNGKFDDHKVKNMATSIQGNIVNAQNYFNSQYDIVLGNGLGAVGKFLENLSDNLFSAIGSAMAHSGKKEARRRSLDDLAEFAVINDQNPFSTIQKFEEQYEKGHLSNQYDPNIYEKTRPFYSWEVDYFLSIFFIKHKLYHSERLYNSEHLIERRDY